MKYKASTIKKWGSDALINGRWIPARPINHKYESCIRRVKHAWGVLIGRYDALDWEDGE